MKLKALPFALISVLSASALVGCIGEDNGLQNTSLSAQTISLSQQGRYLSGVFDQSAAEIVTFDETTNQTLVVNANSGQIDVLSSSVITDPALNQSLDLRQALVDSGIVTVVTEVGAANSVTVHNGLMAVAVQANPKTDVGWILFYKTSDFSFLKAVEVGALPDMVTFTPDGTKVVVACEGEPTAGDYSIDPDGEVSVIGVDWNGEKLITSLTSITFTDFNVGGDRHAELPNELLLNGYQASVAQDLEPEYIAVSADSKTAFIGFQENNGYAEINLSTNTITSLKAYGFKDHAILGNGFDGNNKDGEVNIKSEPALGMYMPDSIASMTYNGKNYLITANEGDDRSDWVQNLSQANCEANDFYWHQQDAICADDITLKDALDLAVYNPADATTKLDFSNFDIGGALETAVQRVKFSHSLTKQFGDIDADNIIDKMLTFGGRSFSIWDTTDGSQVYDSADDFERITAERYGSDFNQSNDKLKAEDRSDNKGPEPEALTVGVINGHTYAFIGLERMGGIMVYDVSNPLNPNFIEYINNRDMTVAPAAGVDAGDLGPEGMEFVSAEQSPTGKPLLIVSSEVSGTTTFYNIDIQ